MQFAINKKNFSLGCLFIFKCLYDDRMFMLFFADVSIFARPPFKTCRSHLNDINFFFSLAVFWLHFGTLKGPNAFLAFLVPQLGPKNIKINYRNPPQVLRKAPYQLAVFWL